MSKKQTPREVLKVDGESLARAADELRRGGIVAFPTETVYGLGAHALDKAAVRRIFEAKGRPSFNPLIVHVADAAAARALVTEWPRQAEVLAETFWPGPLTLVLPKRAIVPDLVTGALATVALRVPAHPVARALLREAGIPIAAPSANRSMGISPTTAQHVRASLGDRVDIILDGGATDVGIESTVIDLTGEVPAILRPGLISRIQIEAAIGAVTAPEPVEGAAPRPSPGMLGRHYAPDADFRVFEDNEAAVQWIEEAKSEASETGAIVWSDLDLPGATTIKLPDAPAGYARGLYAALHRLDARGCNLILAEQVPDTPEWHAIRDRLNRAAHKS
ncbi:MAG TPA: L-threonylcarbamoyladenylate synthase [Longimicrobiaceae bacterium]|nr:L-threonylcarbamoyladenylate synthase [Longimicrobiaceae bacterium]